MAEKFESQSTKRSSMKYTKATRSENKTNEKTVHIDDSSTEAIIMLSQPYLPTDACASIIGTFDTFISNIMDDECCCCYKSCGNLSATIFEDDQDHSMLGRLPYAEEQLELSRYDEHFLYFDLALEEEYEV